MKNIIKKINKIFVNKTIVLGLIPFLLIVFWFLTALIFNNKVNFSILLYQQSKNSIKIISDNSNQENKITGKFKANDDNLGLIMFRFNVYSPGSEDIVTFRIKQEGDRNWYHADSFRAAVLTSGELLPMGFPVIKASKGREYQFEILSKNNKVEIDDFNFLAGYEFSKNELISNKGEGLNFLLKKIYTSFTNLDFILSSLKYFIPLLFYLFFYFAIKRLRIWWKILKIEGIYIGIPLFLIFLDIVITKKFYLPVIILLILIWLYSFSKKKLESQINFVLAFILILIWIILILFKITDFQSKINFWTYVFLVIGVLTAAIEERDVKKDENI